MERLLIFGFVLIGEPTGAALIVTAKSLLRFPEVSQIGRDQENPTGGSDPPESSIEEASEYFLVGSLASWLIALASAVLLGTPPQP